MEKKYLAFVAVLLIVIASISFVMALETVYNPFTGKMDYVNAVGNLNLTNGNGSWYNITAAYYFGSGATLTELNVSGNYSSGPIIPSTNNTYDLGSAAKYWQNIYVGVINLLTQLTDNQISDDITANASKLIEKDKLVNTHLHACENVTGSSGALCSNQTLAANNYADSTFIVKSNESNLNVNSSVNWGSLSSINATQMQNNGGVLTIISSWLNGLFYGKADVYNKTEIDANNASWSTTYNSTYAGWAYNQTAPAQAYANDNFYNKSANIILSGYNITNTKYQFYQNSSGANTWQTYVNDSGAFITEYIG